MKLSQLRPCDACGGKIAPIFYVVRISQAIMNGQAINENLGLAAFFGGGAAGFGLAQAMGTDKDVAVVAGDKEPSLMTELFICQSCMIQGHKELDLMMLMEKRNKEKAEADRKQ